MVSLAGGPWTDVGSGVTVTPPAALAYDFSDDNVPWAYPADLAEREELFTADWEPDVPIVTIPTTGDFMTNVNTACNASPVPVVIRLEEAVYHLDSFELAGTSGRQDFSFGAYHGKLRGWLGLGPDKSIIQMDANSMSQAQLNLLATMDPSLFIPNAMGLALIQPTNADRIYIAGVGFRAADQQWLPAVHPNAAALGITPNQPAPHTGVVIGADKNYTISYCALVGAGRAMYAAPPWEHANLNTQYSAGVIHHCDFDGRRHPAIDPARPRRCTIVLGNNEDSHEMRRCWMHHTNLSRYAINDQNQDTQGTYLVTECKTEFIGNGNVDPALNGGLTLGGSTAAVCHGYESTKAAITFRDNIIDVNNDWMPPSGWYGKSQHIGFAHVTESTNRVGGQLYVYGGTYLNSAFPSVDGFLCIRAYPDVAWWTSGVQNTMFVYDFEGGTRKTAWNFTGTWPPTSGQIAAAGVSPETHYIIRTSGS